jgi:hypothetical protein
MAVYTTIGQGSFCGSEIVEGVSDLVATKWTQLGALWSQNRRLASSATRMLKIDINFEMMSLVAGNEAAITCLMDFL